MPGRSSLVASTEQQTALRELAGSAARGGADRVRAVLLTLAGWTAGRIGEAFGVGEDTARRWRHWFAQGGVDALRATLAPGPAAERGERALACARAFGRAGRRAHELDLGPAARRDRGTNRRAPVAVALERAAARKGGFRWRRPRHSLTGRQNRAGVERMGLRLQLRRAQAEAGDVALLFGDESEALTHPYLAHARAERGADLRVQAPGQARKAAMLGVLDALTREALVHTSVTKRSSDFVALLEHVDRVCGPQPGQHRQPTVLVLDNGPIHTSKASRVALAIRSARLTVEWLPRYAPELNAAENTWRDLKRHHLAHRTFCNTNELDCAIHQAAANLNKERSTMHPYRNLPMAA